MFHGNYWSYSHQIWHKQTMRFTTFRTLWTWPKVIVTKVRVKTQKKKHWHVSRKLFRLRSPNLAQRYFATLRFTTYQTLWPRPKVKVAKVRVKGQKKKHCHVSRKLLKIQSPNLAKRYFATMPFTTYQTLWPWPKVTVRKARVKGQKKVHWHVSWKLLKL